MVTSLHTPLRWAQHARRRVDVDVDFGGAQDSEPGDHHDDHDCEFVCVGDATTDDDHDDDRDNDDDDSQFDDDLHDNDDDRARSDHDQFHDDDDHDNDDAAEEDGIRVAGPRERRRRDTEALCLGDVVVPTASSDRESDQDDDRMGGAP